MIILNNWNEIGNAINTLKANGLPLHSDPAKCWDFSNIRNTLIRNNIKFDASIMDFGCGTSIYGAITLEFMRTMGYKKLLGVDLHVPQYARLGASIRGWTKFREFMPYRLRSGDMNSIDLANHSVDMVILLSVVEHGVDLDKMFSTLARILKIGGIIYLSTDYWHKEINVTASLVASGACNNDPLSWTIFDPSSLSHMIALARKHGFCARGGAEIPACQESPVYWQGVNYTFIAIEFEKLQWSCQP